MATIKGYAAIWNTPRCDGRRRVFLRGCFSGSIREPLCDVVCTIDHERARMIARVSDGTLKLSEDDVGLLAIIRPYSNAAGRFVIEQFRRGFQWGMSCSHTSHRECIEVVPMSIGGVQYEAVRDVTALTEVCLSTKPAYRSTAAILLDHNFARA